MIEDTHSHITFTAQGYMSENMMPTKADSVTLPQAQPITPLTSGDPNCTSVC